MPLTERTETMATAAREEPEFTITVYRDHPDWAACSQWFLMRMDLLRELYVATYDVPCDPEDGLPVNMKATARWVKEAHPGCILVYIDL
jgi:hypothetical protein